MKNNIFSKFYLIVLGLLFAQPVNVWAEGAHHGPSLFIMWINFAIFASIIFYFVKKPIVENWKKRVADLETSILRSERALAEAEARLSSVQLKVSSVGDEIVKIQNEISEEAKHESLRIQEQANEQKGRILRQAQVSVDSEIKAVEKAVKSEFAGKVCDLAKNRLQHEFSSEHDRAYRAASLEGLNSLIKNKND